MPLVARDAGSGAAGGCRGLGPLTGAVTGHAD